MSSTIDSGWTSRTIILRRMSFIFFCAITSMGRVKYAVILGCSGFREGFCFDMTFEALAELIEGGGEPCDMDVLGIVVVGTCSALDGTSVD